MRPGYIGSYFVRVAANNRASGSLWRLGGSSSPRGRGGSFDPKIVSRTRSRTSPNGCFGSGFDCDLGSGSGARCASAGFGGGSGDGVGCGREPAPARQYRSSFRMRYIWYVATNRTSANAKLMSTAQFRTKNSGTESDGASYENEGRLCERTERMSLNMRDHEGSE